MLATAALRTKSPEAFRTISEVAVELDVPQHVLRFWEGRFAQVKPVKRAGGRRYYRPEDVDLLRGIRALLYHDGFTIKGVQKILRDKGVRYVADLGRNDAGNAPAPIMRLVESRRTEPSNVIAWDRLAEAVADGIAVQREEPVPADVEVPEAPVVAAPAVEIVPDARPGLCEDERVKLEILLAELLQLKGRLTAVTRRFA